MFVVSKRRLSEGSRDIISGGNRIRKIIKEPPFALIHHSLQQHHSHTLSSCNLHYIQSLQAPLKHSYKPYKFTMKLYAILATLLLSSSISALVIRDTNTDIDTDIDTNSTAIIEDGIPDFDPQELYGDASLVEVEERDLDDLNLEARSPASSIVSCARGYIGTTYLFGGCKSTPPFGPSRGGMDCSCLSRTCVYKATGKTIRKNPCSLLFIGFTNIFSTHNLHSVSF
jgi:hypothetical protein